MKLFKHRVHGKLENSTYVMNNGLAIPNHQNIKDECINRMKEALSVFLNNEKGTYNRNNRNGWFTPT